MMPRFARQTVTIRRAQSSNERGADVRDWSRASEYTINGCSVQLSTTSGNVSDREQASVSATIYAPQGSDMRKGDRVVVGGDVYTIVGKPYDHVSPTGGRDYMSASLHLWEG